MLKINWKKFFTSLIFLIPFILLMDVFYDIIFKQLIWKDVFAPDNLFFKILAAIVGAYFYATIEKIEKK